MLRRFLRAIASLTSFSLLGRRAHSSHSAHTRPLPTPALTRYQSPKKHYHVRLAESRTRYWDLPFEWKNDAAPPGLSLPRLRLPWWNGSRVFNLHMHNKQLHLFKSSDLELPKAAFDAAPDRN